jgi:DNA topoisomerase-1
MQRDESVLSSETAEAAGLVYVSDATPGIRRIRKGDAFEYRGPDGKPVSDERVLKRIRALAIPPAYEDVWICPLPHGHLQATGRDARGRKQYRYHADWRSARDADKFAQMLAFGQVLPKIRRQVQADLAQPIGAHPTRRSVLAALVRLLDATQLRVGNDEYLRANGSFGLTTLRTRHVAVSGSRLRLRFRGKSGVRHEVALEDPRVARVVRGCQHLPGQELFQYEDEAGETHSVGSADVNAYIREAAGGGDFSAKDFRTWHGSVHALALWTAECRLDQVNRRSAKELLTEVARRLGNTVAVCRKSYVHPRVLELLGAADAPELPAAAPRAGLQADERRFLALLASVEPPLAAAG